MGVDYGILVDIEACLGCGVCVVACKQENDLLPHWDDTPGASGVSWNQVLTISQGKYPDLSSFHFPTHCMHCKNPPCIPVCPKEAITQTKDSVVIIHEAKCNGCEEESDRLKKCMTACPYNAIQFNEKKGVAEICTLCIQRLSAGIQPACVSACIGRCLTFGDFNDPDSEVSKIAKAAGDRLFRFLEERGTAPALRYINPTAAPLKEKLDKLPPFYRVTPIYGYGSDKAKPAE